MILLIDGANFMYRARSGFQLGDYNVVFNFVRNLRALVEQFQPTRVIFTLEGAPKRQLQLLPEYKANRAIDASTEAGQKKRKSLDDFRRQQTLIIDMLRRHFPVSVVQHPDFEGDDVIYNLIKNSSASTEWVVVSTDTDFIQLLQEQRHVALYNPVTKAYVVAPHGYDYVTWKALRGDGSDNIPALVRSDAIAVTIAADAEKLREFRAIDDMDSFFACNYELIALHAWSLEEAMGMLSSSPTRDWDAVRALFEQWQFRSLLKEGTWDKLVATFEPLWGTG